MKVFSQDMMKESNYEEMKVLSQTVTLPINNGTGDTVISVGNREMGRYKKSVDAARAMTSMEMAYRHKDGRFYMPTDVVK